jgi:hypothetical protein
VASSGVAITRAPGPTVGGAAGTAVRRIRGVIIPYKRRGP